MLIFEKEYDGESLYDVSRDIAECFDSNYNEIFLNIPQDEYGFQTGSFKITVEWTGD